MKKCKKGLHEMTEENSKLDRRGRKHCRACIRERQSGYHKGSQGVGRHNKGTFNIYRTAMDEALEADPPVIEWRKNRRGVYEAVKVLDPHADTTPGAQARRLRASAEVAERVAAAVQAERQRLQVLELMQQEAAEVVERFRKHRADNTPLMAAARTEI